MTSTPKADGSPTTQAAAPAHHDGPTSTAAVYVEIQRTESFDRLRRSYRGFAFPMTAGFCAWYLLYVLLSSYAPGLMATVLFGHINVAFAFGMLQFVSTFAIAWLYARHADAHLDPRAEEIRGEVERRLSSPTAEAV